jgi:hypothetical protein
VKRWGLDVSGSGYGALAGSCEHSKSSGLTNVGEFLECLSDR